MRKRNKVKLLQRDSAHRKAMLSNMAIALFEHEKIKTTLPKSKELRRTAEKLITLAKKGDLHARRMAARTIRDKEILKKLFDDIGPRFAERNGGYTRILRLGNRPGDGAEVALAVLVKVAQQACVKLIIVQRRFEIDDQGYAFVGAECVNGSSAERFWLTSGLVSSSIAAESRAI